METTIDIDTGGTFTDGTVRRGDEVWTLKTATTPHDLTVCFAEIIEQAAELFEEETRELLGEDELARMDQSAILVNSARGGLVDEAALVDALRTGSIAGAALDVFETEPLPENHPFLEMENVVLSPHTAGSTRDAVTNGPRMIAEGIESLIGGADPDNRIA